jgi:acyl-coenzyme A synthetase/AMP-(fatty) acid ligase
VRLLRESGVCSGSLVLLQAEQARAAETLFWACMAIGALFVPIDVQWPAYMIERAAGQLAPRVVVADAEHLAELTTVSRQAAAISLDSFHDIIRSKDVSSVAAPLALEPVDERQPAALLLTSGSTGTPKAVVHSRRGLAHGAVLTLETFGWQPGERLLNLPELHTMSGLRNALVAAAMGGDEWLPSPVSDRGTISALVDLVVAGGFHHLVAGPVLIKQVAQVGSRLDPASFAHLTGC